MAIDTSAGVQVDADEPNEHGYRTFRLGEFEFSRNEYFAYVTWPSGKHLISADAFLRALQRDIAWGFFYGIVNFDAVVGTVNHYGTVDLFAGRFNEHYRKAELDHMENFGTPLIRETFKAMLDDWTNEGFDPFASPTETGSAFGPSGATTTGPSRVTGSRRRGWWVCAGTSRFAPTRAGSR